MNPFLRTLGFAADDRVVIVHADDIGMCQATLPAIADLFDAGLVSSAAAMAPCPWFPAVAQLCRERPDIDMGVHCTLTAEMHASRWGPIASRDRATGLLDADGYFYHTTADMQANGAPDAVAAELEAQYARAVAAGIDPTHIDSHMGTVFHPAYINGYIELAQRARVPAFILRAATDTLRQIGMPQASIAALSAAQAEYEARGLPVVDRLFMMPLTEHTEFADRLALARHVFDTLEPGLTYLLLHPAADTPELRALAGDWRARSGDYRVFCDDGLRRHVRASGVQVIGWRPVRDALRSKTDPSTR